MTRQEFIIKANSIVKSVVGTTIADWVERSELCRGDFDYAYKVLLACVKAGQDNSDDISYSLFGCV